MSNIARLKRRAEYLKVADHRRKSVTPGLILQMGRPVAAADVAAGKSVDAIRVGFTASRKVGMAVERNRARRRLKAAVAAVMPLHAAPGHDYVVIARNATMTRPFAALIGDLEAALRQLGAYRSSAAAPDRE